MVELEYPPFTAELRQHHLYAQRPLPLAFMHNLLWSKAYGEHRDRDLEMIASQTHLIEFPGGHVYELVILHHVPELIEAITILDTIVNASRRQLIGWNEEDQRHVLVDAELTGMGDEFGDMLRAFLESVRQTPAN